MTLAQVLQLYAPFVGLMALAFWMGVLSQRVKQLEKTCDHGKVSEQVIELRVKMDGAEKKLESIDMHLQRMDRQLGNIAMGRVGHSIELGSDR